MVLTGFLAVALLPGNWLGFRDGWHLKTPDWWDGSANNIGWAVTMLLLATGLFGYLHFQIRKIAARRVVKLIGRNFVPGLERDRLRTAFLTNTRPWHSIFTRDPVGWGKRSRKRLQSVIAEANEHVQTLNDAFTNPSGKQQQPATPPPVVISPQDTADKSASSETTTY
jgi:hypothetical protein